MTSEEIAAALKATKAKATQVAQVVVVQWAAPRVEATAHALKNIWLSDRNKA